MMEISAVGIKGYLLFVYDRPVFRVYDEDKSYKDYEIRHDDLAIEIWKRASLFEENGECWVGYPSRK